MYQIYKEVEIETIKREFQNGQIDVIFCAINEWNLPLLKEPKSSCYDVGVIQDVLVDRTMKVSLGVKWTALGSYALELKTRSSTFDKTGLILANGTGEIDCSYNPTILANVIPLNYLLGQLSTPSKLIASTEDNRIDYFQVKITHSLTHNSYQHNKNQLNIVGIVNKDIYENFGNHFISERTGGFGSTDKK